MLNVHGSIIYYLCTQSKPIEILMTMRQFLHILCLIFMPLSIQGQESVHGVCGLYGGNVLWNLKGDTLFIHGKGEMANYERNGLNGIAYAAPWKKEYSNQIKCVVIEDSVTSVGEYAFEYCQKLTSVTFSQSLRTISKGAFSDCTSLDSIVIPDSVLSIGAGAFSGCSSLRSVKLPALLTKMDAYAFTGCESLDSICIPKGIKTLDATFDGCKSLRYVEMPSSITTINAVTFRGCESLRSIDIPNSVTTIGMQAFQYCTALDSITIPNNVTSLGKYNTFEGCTSLKSVTLSNSLTEIPPLTFNSCTSLTSIVIPDGVATIKWSVFKDCEHLSRVVIPKSVTYVGPEAFYNCLELEDVFCYASSIPQGDPSVFDNFGHFPLTEATLHVPQRLMGGYANNPTWNVFGKMVAVPDVIEQEPENNSTIFYTFNDDETSVSVTSGPEKYAANVKIPAQILADGRYYRVTAVESGAFMKSPDLYTVFLNNSIKSVGRFAFADCSSLVSVRLPNSINAIEDYTFSSCISLSGISIPASVASIGEGAFADCRSLKTISLPARTTSIGIRAFANCSALATVELGNRLLMIDDNAFENCRSLKTITLPNTMTLIGSKAFSGCTDLAEVVFDGCKAEIGTYAFSSCTGLKDIYTYSDIPPAADETAFEGSNYYANLHVPAASLEVYESTAPWCYFKNIIPHAESNYGGIICQYDYNTEDLTATLRKVTVSKNTYEDKLVIPAELMADGKIYKVTAIAKWALKYIRPGFSSIEIPSTVRTIVTNTLDITERLKTIKIMGDVERIEKTAFAEILYTDQGPLNNTLNDFYCYSSFVPELSPIAFSVGTSKLSRKKSDDDIAEIEENGETYYMPRYFTYTWWDANNNAHQATQYQYQIIEHATLHVPASLVESYKQTFPWNMFGNIVALTEEEMADGIEEIVNGKLSNSKSIYTLQGQRIKTLQKGLNIVDGKKILIK